MGLITLIVLGIYTIATWWLAKTSRDSLKAANDSFAQTLCQMKAQTAAQQEANRITKESLVSVERAFVTFMQGLQTCRSLTLRRKPKSALGNSDPRSKIAERLRHGMLVTI